MQTSSALKVPTHRVGAELPAVGGRSTVGRLAATIAAALDAPSSERSPRLVSALQAAVAAPDLLLPEQILARADGYARHLLHADPAGRFTILAIVWGPGQASPVHAHHTWCAYAVRDNVLTETVYRFDAATSTAHPLRTAERHAGYGCYSEAGLDQVHRLGNETDAAAISIHVYGVDGAHVATGVNRIVASHA